MNFRRTLKHILKNNQTLCNVEFHNVSRPITGSAYWNKIRAICEIAEKQLETYGLYGNLHHINNVLRIWTKAKGRHLKRIGQAAKKQGKLADLELVAIASHFGYDLRIVPFNTHVLGNAECYYVRRDFITKNVERYVRSFESKQ